MSTMTCCQRNSKFQMVLKVKITLEAISFWRNISFSIFKFSPFSYIMKACRWNFINFSKFANTFKKRGKTLIQQSVRTEKLRKVELGFVIILLIIFFVQQVFLFTLLFYFASSFEVQFLLFDFKMTQEKSKGKIGNDKQLGMANYNTYFKNNFSRLVMSVTQINFLY